MSEPHIVFTRQLAQRLLNGKFISLSEALDVQRVCDEAEGQGHDPD